MCARRHLGRRAGWAILHEDGVGDSNTFEWDPEKAEDWEHSALCRYLRHERQQLEDRLCEDGRTDATS